MTLSARSSRVENALALYDRLWNDLAHPMRPVRRELALGMLNGLVVNMTPREQQQYYHALERARRAEKVQ